ncbi:hypothetical protein WME97_26360 [Sorangium sp. So ce367]|uniref:hypothetical protein n=1 Tax=Sorangium sp. So ce367 TaxID=3133305 RepID=UPI003F6018BA
MLSYPYRHTRAIAAALTGVFAATLAGCMVDAGPPADLAPDPLDEEWTQAGALGEQAVALDTLGGSGEPLGKDAPAANRSRAVCDAALAVCRAANEGYRAACHARCEQQYCDRVTGVCLVSVSPCYAECDRNRQARETTCLANYVRCLAP